MQPHTHTNKQTKNCKHLSVLGWNIYTAMYNCVVHILGYYSPNCKTLQIITEIKLYYENINHSALQLMSEKRLYICLIFSNFGMPYYIFFNMPFFIRTKTNAIHWTRQVKSFEFALCYAKYRHVKHSVAQLIQLI